MLLAERHKGCQTLLPSPLQHKISLRKLVNFANAKKVAFGLHFENQYGFSMFIHLLLQYGFINTCLKSLVVEKYGEETWEKLR